MKNKDEKKVISFVTGAKKEFSDQLLRDAVKDIDITELNADAENESKYTAIGSAMAISPTGKNKTYRFEAVVEITDGACAFKSIKLELLE